MLAFLVSILTARFCLPYKDEITEIKQLCFDVDYYLRFGRRLPTYKKWTTETQDECGPSAMKYSKIETKTI